MTQQRVLFLTTMLIDQSQLLARYHEKYRLRDPKDQAGRLMAAGDRLFKEYMAVVEGKTGKEFQKALGRWSFKTWYWQTTITKNRRFIL